MKYILIILMAILSLELQPKQYECYRLLSDVNGPKNVLFAGAKFVGKSYFAGEYVHSRAIQFPGTNGTIIRTTYEEVRDNHIYPLLSRRPELEQYYNKTDHVITYPNGSRVFFKYCASVEDARKAFWGIQYATMVLDEAGDHTEEEVQILKLSNRLDPKQRNKFPSLRPRLLLPGNPGGIGHSFLQRLFVDRQFMPNERPSDYGAVLGTLDDNPIGIAANPEYKQSLMDLPESQRNAWLYGRWDAFAGQFFKGFKIIPTRAIRELGPVNLFAGADWGRRDAASSHLVAVNYHGKHTVCGEVYGTGLNPESFGESVMIKRRGLDVISTFADQSIWAKDQYGREIFADGKTVDDIAATAYSIADQIGATGLVLTRASRDRMARWTRMQTLMEQGNFEVMDCCVHLINELKYAVYNNKGNRRKEDIDEKCKDHALDDVGYCCLHTYVPAISEQRKNPMEDVEWLNESENSLEDLNLGKISGGV